MLWTTLHFVIIIYMNDKIKIYNFYAIIYSKKKHFWIHRIKNSKYNNTIIQNNNLRIIRICQSWYKQYSYLQ
jgi:hypothetical protein